MTYPLRFRKTTDTVAANGTYTPDASEYGYFELEYQGGPGTSFTLNTPINTEEGQPLLFTLTFPNAAASPPGGASITFSMFGNSGPWWGHGPTYAVYVEPTSAPTYVIDGIDWYTKGLPIP